MEDQENQRREKVLTFRDMSHLSYFGLRNNTLAKANPHQTVSDPSTTSESHTIASDLLTDLLDLVQSHFD